MLLLALGVSADAFAVAVGRGLAMRRLDLGQTAALALTFGVFQAVMPLLGHALGEGLLARLSRYDGWIGAALLAAVGGKMLLEALADDEARGPRRLPWTELLALGVATSIDALAVGVSLVAVEVDIVRAAALIGVTTLALTVAGAVVGQRIGGVLRRPAEIAGAVVLLVLAVVVLTAP